MLTNVDEVTRTRKFENERVTHVIYTTGNNVMSMNCDNSSYGARNCHTTTQSPSGSVTFADPEAGR
jgi:hypothetical protein